MGVSLLCGFGFAGKDYVYKQFETAEPVAGVLVKDASAYVTIRTPAAGNVEAAGVQAEQIEIASAAGKVALRDARARTVDLGAAAGSVSIENLNAEEQLSIGSAVGSASLKQVTAGDIAIGSVIGRVKLEDVRARSYSEVGFIMRTSGRVQKIR